MGLTGHGFARRVESEEGTTGFVARGWPLSLLEIRAWLTDRKRHIFFSDETVISNLEPNVLKRHLRL